MPASYFDVDGTLVGTNLVHPTLYYMLHLQTPLHSLRKLGRAVVKAPAMLWAEMRDRRMFNEILFSAYEGISQDRLVELAASAYRAVMRPRIYPGARDLIAECRKAGHEVILVSGALDILLEHLARDLGGVDRCIANRLEIHEGRATGKLLRPIVAGPTKARLIADDAKAHGHALEACFAYSDSYSDVPMLSIVGNPAAVNPDRRLALLARAYHWPILNLGETRR